ncbi:hypothetical protein N9R39_01030 [Amylibacter sp.]|nr:hypothetical protein [Amylibacter sp.]
MYILNCNQIDVYVFKHSELAYFSKNELKKMRQKNILFLYIGGHIPKNSSLFDIVQRRLEQFSLVIAGYHALNHFDLNLNDPSTIKLSGFNFLPSFSYRAVAKQPKDCLFYSGNLTPRKNFRELLRLVLYYNNQKSQNCIKSASVSLVARNKFDYVFIAFLKMILKNTPVQIKSKFFQSQLSRQEVYRLIDNSKFVFAPYIDEGAARIVAEAEVLGKPLIFNKKMIGSSDTFLDPRENLMYEDFSDINLKLTLKAKSCKEKKSIYLEKYNKLKIKKILKERLNLEMHNQVNLINAFSGHQNNLPTAWTNKYTDEINNLKSAKIVYNILVGNEKIPFSYLNSSIFKLPRIMNFKRVLGKTYIYKYLFDILILSYRLKLRSR